MITNYGLNPAKELLDKGYILRSNTGRIFKKEDGILYARVIGGDYYESDFLENETNFTIESDALVSKSKNDMVNHPEHYTGRKFECIEVIEEITKDCNEFEAYLVGTILKYLWRFKNKNGLEDLKKAQWYLNKLIEKLMSKEYNILEAIKMPVGTEFEKPVSFMKAIKAYTNGKDIKCEFNSSSPIIYKNKYCEDECVNILHDNYGNGISVEEILNGEWYIY